MTIKLSLVSLHKDLNKNWIKEAVAEIKAVFDSHQHAHISSKPSRCDEDENQTQPRHKHNERKH